MNISLASILLIRSEWEELVFKFKFLEEDRKHGTINNIKWFLENGHNSNRLRRNYKKAKAKAEEFLEAINEVMS
jgi:hypothetical protein